MKTFAVAGATFKEAVNSRAYHVLILYLLVLIACSRVLVPISLGAGEKIAKDFGFSAMSVLTVLAAVMLGADLLQQRDRKPLSFFLSKPLSRQEFVLGRYIGLNSVLLSAVAVMGITMALFLLYQVGTIGTDILKAVLLNGLELVLIAGVILFFSSFSTAFVTVSSTMAFYVAGHFRYDLKLLAEHTVSPVTKVLCRVFYYVIPNLQLYNVRGELVHGIDVPWERIVVAGCYTVLYAGAMVGLALVLFARRDFR